MNSRFFTGDAVRHMYWRRYRRRAWMTGAAFFVTYSFASAELLNRHFDADFMTERFYDRVASPEAHKRPALLPSLFPSLVAADSSAQADAAAAAAAAQGDRRRPDNNAQWRHELSGPVYMIDAIERPNTTVDNIFVESVQTPPQWWDDVACTINVGDIVVVRGTGSMSWRITNLTYAWRRFDPWALKYSHVGVVVEVDRTQDPPAVYMLEAVDNRDASVPDRDGHVRHRQAMVVNVRDRLLSLRPEDAELVAARRRDAENPTFVTRLRHYLRPPPTDEQLTYRRRCYNRACVRRLEGVDWDKDGRRERLAAFVAKVVGRPLDASPLISLAQASPALYSRADPVSVSCAELVVDLYKECGIVVPEAGFVPFRGDGARPAAADGTEQQEAKASEAARLLQDRRDIPDTARTGKSVAFIPFHMTPKGQHQNQLVFVDRLARMGPEEKIIMMW